MREAFLPSLGEPEVLPFSYLTKSIHRDDSELLKHTIALMLVPKT